MSSYFDRAVATVEGNVVSEADIVAVYRLLLGRAPDPDGWRTFSSLVGRAPLTDLVAAIICSEEFRGTPLHGAVARREVENLSLVDVGDGLRLFVSPHDTANTSIHRSGSYEPHLVAALDAILAPGKTVCVVGGNIGYHVVRAAQRVGPTGRVLAFEARPDNVDLLRRNAALNRLDNVLVFSFAVSDARAFHRYVPAQGTNGYIRRLDPAEERIDDLRESALVQAVCLDELAAVLSPIDVLQLDVEGAEGLVLRGAERVVADNRPVIFTELSCGQLERVSGMSAEQLLTPLASLGYTFASIQFTGGVVEFGTDVTLLGEYARAQSGSHIDVQCTPGDFDCEPRPS